MFKTNEEIIIIQAKAATPIPTGVVFWSHDKGTAKMLFQLQKDYVNQTLSEGTIVPICLDFVGGRHIYHAVIEDAINGIVSIVLEDNILGYVGRVTGSIYIELPDSRSLDTAGRFTFDIKRSPIDLNTPELEDYYWQGFNEIIQESKRLIDQVESNCETVLNDLSSKVTSLENQTSDIKSKQAEILKSIEEHEVFTKQESSANVIDQIAGAESAILKKEILVNGNEGTASRYANDLGTQNLMGILKSSRFIYDLDSNRLKAPGLIEGKTITEVTLPAGTYVVSLRLFVKSSKSTSFVCEVDGTDNSSFGFLNIQNYTINTVYTRTLELTKETQIRYKSWGNTDNEPIEFEMKIEKEKYTKFTPAPEWVIDGIVPFNEDDYNALLSTNEIVNAETYVPERGAEIVFEFPVIKALEVNRPFLFEGCTTDTEKIEKYISIMRSVLVPSASRGGGLSTATGNSSNYSRLYVKNTTNNSVRYCGTDAINSSNNLREFNTKLDTSSMKQVQKNGSYIFKITSKENENIGQSGAISDGISPAWVEVKDIRLIVEVEASANEIIKLEIAANHVENLATQDEAESGTDNAKTMTPLRTAQQINKKAVTIAGNQTIGGIKNFKDGLMINDVSLSTITRKVIYEADGVGGYFNAADKFTLGASGKIDKIVLLWSRVDDTAGTLLNYSWSQTVLSPDDLVVGNSYRIQMTTDNYKFVTFANESGNVTISGANENSVAPNRIYRIKRIIAYLKN